MRESVGSADKEGISEALGSGARSAGKPGAGSCQGKALLATAKARDPGKLQARLQGST